MSTLSNILFFSVAVIPQVSLISYLYFKINKDVNLDNELRERIQDLTHYTSSLEDEISDLRVYKRLWQSMHGENETYK